MKKAIREIKELLTMIVIVFICTIFIQGEVGASTVVKQSSMEGTLQENDLLIVEKISYKFNAPESGDIIIFREESTEGFWGSSIGITLNDLIRKLTGKEQRKRYVKRIIGLPRDEVEIKEDGVFVNGDKLDEIYIKGITEDGSYKTPLKVPKGRVFVLGDNRENSTDSRHFGFIDYDRIDGKVILRLYPFNKIDTY